MKLYYKLIGHPNRRTYWTCSKFAEKLRKWFGVTEKPSSATPGGWRDWKNANKETIGYWITEELLDTLQDIAYFPHDVYSNINRYVRNRYIDKLHYLDTKLKKGDYYEVDTRILHGMFEALVDFVEIENAHMQGWSHDKKIKTPDAGMGMLYLDWEIGLGNDSPIQSANATVIRSLYWWWKYVRPHRPDPWIVSGLQAYYDNKRTSSGIDDEKDVFALMNHDDDTEAERNALKIIHDKHTEIETAYENEDTEMLIRLIKIRTGMWT